MFNETKFRKFVERFPHRHTPFFARPDVSRRSFFGLAAAGVTGACLTSTKAFADVITRPNVTLLNKAKNVIMIQFTGAPSHTDTFDLKVVDGTTPARVAPALVNGLNWPTGIFPKLADNVGDLAIARSTRSWAAAHSLAQTWMQIGRSPAAVLGDVAPNIGSVVSMEKRAERKPNQIFPAFLALGANNAIGAGYFPAAYEPFKTEASTAGLANTANQDGQTRFDDKWNLLQQLDGGLRVNSPLGDSANDYGDFYKAARGLMYNPAVDKAFKFTPADSARYGGTAFGNSLLVAKQVLAADEGTRYIQVALGGWDMHTDIYGVAANRNNNIFTLGKTFDDGVSTLLNDLKSSGLLAQTLVVMMGEFGRTVGPVNNTGGRDHFLQQFAVFAGAGVKGGRALGSTDDFGRGTTEYGWSEERDFRPEDVEATIYSALGINYLTIRYDDPFKRGFEYVPYANDGLYKPIAELWA